MEVLTYLMLAVCVNQIRGAMVDVRPYKSLLLNLHNDYRRQVQPPATNMQIMYWNETLSNEAAMWIRGCRFEHQYGSRGENLAYNSHPLTTEEYIDNALEAWYNEKNIYRLGTQPCDRACHYTQMVWHKTTQVGCAMIKCPGLYVFGNTVQNAWYLGCFYDPKGNWVGERPYEAGAPCTQCLKGQSCDRKLCTGHGEEVCEDKKDRCEMWKSMGECRRNPDYMTLNCRRSCEICKGPGGSEMCQDKNRNCAMWAQRGECRKNKAWMLPNCPKSCYACNGGRNQTDSDSGNENGSGNGSGSGSGGGDNNGDDQDETVCSNKINCCASLKRRGYCRRYRKFMRENCKAACSQC